MPTAINLNYDQIDSQEKRSQFPIAVIGCGQQGIFFAVSFATAGFKVTCLDADASIIKNIAKGKVASLHQETQGQIKNLITARRLTATSEMEKTLPKFDIIIISVPAKIDDKKKADYSEATNALKKVGSALHIGALVIISDIMGFGFTDGVAKEILENSSGLKAGVDFGLVYMPALAPCIKASDLANPFRLTVASIGKAGLDAATNIAKTITPNVTQASDIKTAELAVLFKIAQQDVYTALANELAVFCEGTNSDYFKISNLLGECFLPSAIELHNNDSAYLLCESADFTNAKLRLSALSRQINEDMVKHAINLTQDALRDCGKSLRRSRVAVIGSIHQANSSSQYIKLLGLKGAKINLYDPASKGESFGVCITKGNLTETVEGADCIVLTGDELFSNLNLKKLKPLTKAPSILVDLAGICDPDKVRAEGFIYRGIGRGTG